MRALRQTGSRWALGGLSAGLLVVYFVLDGLAADVLWDVVVGAQLLVAAAFVRGFTRHRRAWASIVAAQVCFLAGDVGFTVLEFGLQRELFPSFADALYLAGYPLLTLGLLPLVRTRLGRRDVGALIDAAIVTLASSALLWVFVMDPAVGDSDAGLLARIVAVAYPAGDVLALAALALLLSRRRELSAPLVLTAGSITALLAADVVFALLAVDGEGYSLGAPVDALWWLAYTLVTLAVMQPGCEDVGDVTPDEVRLTPVRLVALALAASAAPVIVIARLGRQAPSQVVVLLGVTVLLFLLVIARLWLIAGDLDDSRVRLSHEATHDSLTGLANRARFGRELDDAIGRDDRSLAVLCLDLDDFKTVNDQLGHPVGDRLLQVVSDRLREITRSGDVVARLGGDEFAILLRSTDAVGATATADRLIDSIRRPADVGLDAPVRPNASIGIVIGDAASTTEALMRDGDIAMYRAKRGGKGRWSLFDVELGGQVVDWLGLHSDLHDALAADQLFVEYQPVVRLPDRAVVGAEALLRWRHPVRGLVGPDEFVPVAEESGLIVPIGAWVLERACLAARRWDPRDDGAHVSVNISPVQIVHPGLLDDVRRALDVSGLDPARLVLEITETSDLADEAPVTEVLAELRALGVRIAIDDLGAGYASLRYLRASVVDTVKLDRSFLRRGSAERELLRGLVGLSSSLDMTTVVEGVETVEHERIAVECGARCAQGWLYGRPGSADALAALLRPAVLLDR